MELLRLYYTSDSFFEEYVLYFTLTFSQSFLNYFVKTSAGVQQRFYYRESIDVSAVLRYNDLMKYV